MEKLDIRISSEFWNKVKELAGRPLQVMVSSNEVAMTSFLIAGGFVCKRKCYEIDACICDFVGSTENLELYCCSVGDQEYEYCCNLIYRHYVNTHEGINPWTADYMTFCSELPKNVLYSKNDNSISSIAFIEHNEIAYAYGEEEKCFSKFAQTLISSMFEKYDRICFECDDCDWAAITLKNLFINQDDTSFCTYILADK